MLRTLIRSRLLRLCLYIAVVLAVLGMVAGDASAASRTPCGTSLTWSVQPSLVTPDDAAAAIASAYEQVAGPARLDAISGDAGTVRFLWIDKGTGSSETPGTSTGTSVLGGVEYVQHAYLPGVEGDALRAQVLVDVLKDLGAAAPTSGSTLNAEDAAALTAACAAAPEPTADPTAAPDDAPGEDTSADDAAAPDDSAPVPADDAGAPDRTLLGLALVGVAVVGVAGYLLVPVVLARLRRKPAPDTAGSTQ